MPTKLPAVPSKFSSEVATTWAFLEEGLDDIMTNPTSHHKLISLYTVVYNYCTSPTPPATLSAGNRSGARLNGLDLYNNLIRYLNAHVEKLREETNALEKEALLRFYSAEWGRYTASAKSFNKIFTYLNRHWVTRERDEGRKGVYPVYTLALAQWKNSLLIPIQSNGGKVTVAILRLIESQRNGDMIDETLVKSVVDSFISLGIDDTDINNTCLDIYKEHFEFLFLQVTARYYRQESQSLLASSSVSDYLKKAEERLQEEEDRVERYLITKTRKALLSECERVLIQEHSVLLWDSAQRWFDLDFDEHLQRMHALLSRIPEGLEPLRNKFEEHVKNSGLSAISKLVRAPGSSTVSLDPRAYVDALLAVHQKHSETVARSFRGDAGFVASLDKGCRGFVNRNAATGSSNSKSPELIAKYADLLLRKGSKLMEGDDLESALNRVVVLFKYIEDKDAFQTFYIAKLSLRLVHGMSLSDESEASMASKLKEVMWA